MATHRKKSRPADDSHTTENNADDENLTRSLDDEEEDDMDMNNSDMDSDEESEEENMDVQERVNVEFEARNPEEMDFHGVRQLLSQLFLRTNIDLSALADMIIHQSSVGSVIKQYVDGDDEDGDDEDEDCDPNHVFGVISCINVTENQNLLSQLREHVMKKMTSDKDAVSKFSAIMDSPTNRIGLIINERYVNIPPQIAVPSFESLRQEMETANKKGQHYDFSHYIMIAKKFKIPTANSTKRRKGAAPMEQEIYSNGEEEFFANSAEFRAIYSVKSERDSGVVKQWDSELEEQYEPLREILIIKSHDLPRIVDSVKQALAQALANNS